MVTLAVLLVALTLHAAPQDAARISELLARIQKGPAAERGEASALLRDEIRRGDAADRPSMFDASILKGLLAQGDDVQCEAALSVVLLAQLVHLAPDLVRVAADESRSTDLRILAMDRLEILQAFDAMGSLAPLMKSKEHAIRVKAAATVGGLFGHAHAKAIADLLEAERTETSEIIHAQFIHPLLRQERAAPLLIGALLKLNAREHAEKIRRFLKSGEPDARHAAMEAAAEWKLTEWSPDLEALLDLKEDVEKSRAMGALIAVESPAAAGVAERLAREATYTYRGRALAALARLKGESVRELLVESLKSSDLESLKGALDGLATLGTEDDARKVVSFLAHRDSDVQSAAWYAMEQLRHRALAKEVAFLLASPDEYVRCRAARWLGRAGAVEHAGSIAALLRSGDRGAIMAASEALGELGAAQFAPELAEALRHPHPNVRESVMSALVTLKAERFHPRIAFFLKSSERIVRHAAIREIGRARATDYFGDVAAILKDPKEEGITRHCALFSLADMDPGRAREIIEKYLDDPSLGLRIGAVLFLLKMGSRAAIRPARELLERAPVTRTPGIRNLLHRMKEPEAHARVESAEYVPLERAPGPGVARLPALREDLKRRLGIELEASPEVNPNLPIRDSSWMAGERIPLGWAIHGERYEPLLEKDRIRLVTPRASREFWIEWCRENEKD